jgi:hypothetical protein
MATKKDERIRAYLEYYKDSKITYTMFIRPSREIIWRARCDLDGKKIGVPDCITYGSIKAYARMAVDNYTAELKWAKKAKRCILFNPTTFHIDTEFLRPVSKGYKTRDFSVLAYERVPGKNPLYIDHTSEDFDKILIVPSEQDITGAFLSSLTDAVRASQDKLYEELAEKMK